MSFGWSCCCGWEGDTLSQTHRRPFLFKVLSNFSSLLTIHDHLWHHSQYKEPLSEVKNWSYVWNCQRDVRDVNQSPRSVLRVMLGWRHEWDLLANAKVARHQLNLSPWQPSPKYPASMATVTTFICENSWCPADTSHIKRCSRRTRQLMACLFYCEKRKKLTKLIKTVISFVLLSSNVRYHARFF